ncbi:hypothetical protein [Antarctobacter sp.]|uniref:hypothetical protein n=1 Tax=Antarctobacter sp. TaxID=1872577 RepID=UPI002B26A08F|nr:hypothetical protein [Antarctobacter sp.]
MPLDLTFFPQWKFVHVDYFGRATVGDIVRGYSDMLAHPEAGHLSFSLNDMRGLEGLNVFYDGMMHMAKTVSSDAAQRSEPLAMAVVANQRNMMPILTDYCAQVSRAGTARCGLLSDIADAVDWLGLSRDVLDLRLSGGRRIADPLSQSSTLTASREPPDPAGDDHRQRS